jgi:hypothetical protein
MRHLKDLPNTEGFKFIGITDDGEVMDCVVVHNNKFCASVENAYGEPCFFKLAGWEDKATQP